MNRPSDPDMTRRLIDHARNKLPDLTMRTTFIVGYPGETEQQFERLLAFVESEQFDHVGVFTYSPEPGTVAADLGRSRAGGGRQKSGRGRIMEAQQRSRCARTRRWWVRRSGAHRRIGRAGE